jgi:hypothetical protein
MTHRTIDIIQIVYSADGVYGVYSIHYDSVLFNGGPKVGKIPSDENLYGDHTSR